MRTDIRVKEARVSFFDERLRTPLVLATGAISEVTRARVELTVETRDGRVGRGAGEMILGDAWGFPSAVVGHADRDAVMRRVTERFAAGLLHHEAPDHPIGLFEDAANGLDTLRREASAEAGLPEVLPLLGALVCAAASDLAAHDAFGRALGLCSYDAMGPDHCDDLSRWLGPAFSGRFLPDSLDAPRGSMPAIHLVGGGDKLSASEATPDDPDDGLPTTLEGWIDRDGVSLLKVKIKGDDLIADADRIASVHRIAHLRLGAQGKAGPILTVDPNERCADPSYGVELLAKLARDAPGAGEALALFEQPTARDLTEPRHDQRPLSRLRPVLVDEGLTDVRGLDLALELGWTGVALKICKGLSPSLLIVAKARAAGLTLAVMDLTLPGTALVHSAGFAARVGGAIGLEANARQYLPHACPEVAARFPGISRVREGNLRTAEVGPRGLGA